MGLFGKKQVSEREAAWHFVDRIIKGAQEHWRAIAKELNGVLGEGSIPVDERGGSEFVLAVIVFEIQALPNLLPPDQAIRVREHIMQWCTFSMGPNAAKVIHAYQNAWDQTLREKEPPFYGIASVLFDRLECHSAVGLGEAKFKSPLLLMGLAEKLVSFVGGWWKAVIQQYKLVPEPSEGHVGLPTQPAQPISREQVPVPSKSTTKQADDDSAPQRPPKKMSTLEDGFGQKVGLRIKKRGGATV